MSECIDITREVDVQVIIEHVDSLLGPLNFIAESDIYGDIQIMIDHSIEELLNMIGEADEGYIEDYARNNLGMVVAD